jgi:hypothetical protein
MSINIRFDSVGTVPDKHAHEILEKVKKLAKQGDRENDVVEGYLALLGMGGTSENSKGTFGFELNEHRYEIESLRKIVRAEPYNATLRQFARTMADRVHLSLSMFELTPPIASKLGLRGDEVYWGFDFADRSSLCPDSIKIALQTHLEKALARRGIKYG